MFSSDVDNGRNPLSGIEYLSSNYTLPQILHSSDPLTPHFSFPVLNPQVITSEPLTQYMELSRNENVLDGCARSGVLAKKPVKKDRHSKINTAQGLRDRRVRLSIGIAREFFDLQEMLGFDKASKTLEWLLKKSKKAIQELAQTKNDDEMSNSSTGVFQEEVSEINKSENRVSRCKEKKKSKRFESFDEIRAKARESTRENKMCNKMNVMSTCPNQDFEHLGWSNMMQCEEVERSSTNLYEQIMMTSFYEQTILEDSSKKKFSTSTPGFGTPNLRDGINSKDSSSSKNSRNINRVFEIPENWQMDNNNNQFGDSAFSAGFEVYGKPW